MVKDKIRKSLLEQGLTLSSQSIDQLNTQVQKNIIESLDLSKMKNVLLYFPYKQEIKTNLLHQELAKYSHNIYMPKIFPDSLMKFNLYTSEYSLVKNKYGITEVDNKEYLEPHFFDAMFIPFVGVDVNGMAPLHHHYQKKGFHESKIVSRFWIVGVMLAILSIVTLKLR